MAKKQKAPQLSPENYIRQRARTLPIYKCYVNGDWKEANMANILIVRQHVTGNLTVGLYLVDTMCLGVKDSFFKFNISTYEFEKIYQPMNEEIGLEEIPYNLAHNIIFGAIEFAEEYGFSPYKEFTSTTIYLLEEDTDEIELIDIDFGDDGKPVYVQGPNDTLATANRIVKTLEKTAGKGNFHFIVGDNDWGNDYDDDDENDYDEDEDDYNYYENHYGAMSLEEKKALYESLRHANINEETDENMIALIDSIFNDICDPIESENIYNGLHNQLENYQILSIDALIPDELVGISGIEPEIKEELADIFYTWNNDKKQMTKRLDKLKKEYKNIPFIDFLDLFLFYKSNKMKKFIPLQNKCKTEYPHYHLFKITEYLTEEVNNEIALPYPDDFFKGRAEIHPIELNLYFICLNILVSEKNNNSLLKGVSDLFHYYSDNFLKYEFLVLTMSFSIEKMRIISKYFNLRE